MSNSTLLALAERCEREEPSWGLSVDIHIAVTPGAMRSTSHIYAINDGTKVYNPPSYTTSLDSAVTLVPKGIEWNLTNLYGIAMAEVGLNFSDGNWQTGRHKGGHMALALCAAALRARAAMEA